MSDLPALPSRYILKPKQRRDYPLTLITHGEEMLESLSTLGFATNEQLARLHFNGKTNLREEPRSYAAAQRAANTSLQRLWQSGFIRRVPVMLKSKRTGFGYQHFVNALTRKGMKAVPTSDTSEKPIAVVKVSNQTVDHSLAINDFYVLARRGSEMRNIEMHNWLNDRQLTAMRVRRHLRLVSIPDGFFVLSHQGRYCGHFLEIDTGSVSVSGRRTPRSWAKTVADYGKYFRDFYNQDGYFKGYIAPIVLTVTSSRARLEHLLQATKQGGGAGVYWYTTMQELEATSREASSGKTKNFDPDAFWKPIWRVVNDRTPRSLSDRLNSH